MGRSINIATLNIHKGLSPLNRRLVIHEIKEELHSLDSDILFLQEVQGEHATRAARFAEWPAISQHEHIADGRYRDIVYGVNAQHRHGHHGNAIISAFPVVNWTNRNVSHHRFEQRGHLLARIEIPGWPRPLTCACVHLGLLQSSRNMQVQRLTELLAECAAPDDPLIVAGDFNDWRFRKSGVSGMLFSALGLCEAFEVLHGRPARTFPALLPLLTLDRIYVRGLEVCSARRIAKGRTHGSGGLSDHAGLFVELRPQ
ncbi:MAG TPA: endonuclease/exonuclease/phosphatase family protein [Usitatibacteraceae bacterium]|nr:endonuclease/exonuclease/phosphatase family protein [Usitatibacteraceae bacterium]